MCNLILFTGLALLCGISVNAFPAVKDSDTIKSIDSNKTDSEKSPNSGSAKSTRRVPVVPFYPNFVSSPNYHRGGVPMQLASTPYMYDPPKNYVYHPPANSYAGYQSPMFVQPVPQISNAVFTKPAYQHQSYQQPAYSYAPQATNSYTSYGYRNAADEEDKVYSVEYLDQSHVQSSMPYTATTTYVVKPSNHYINTNEYPAEGMEPRDVIAVEPQQEIRKLDFVSENSPFTAAAETAEPVYYDMSNSYYARPGMAAFAEQPQHLGPLNYRITEPSAYYPMMKPYANLENMNWALPRGDNNVPVFVM